MVLKLRAGNEHSEAAGENARYGAFAFHTGVCIQDVNKEML